MPLSPEMERLKKAAASKSEDEAGVIADAAAELENSAALPDAVAAFARTAGIDPVAIQTAPEATAQAFSREMADLRAAQSALPKPPNADTLHERRLRVNSSLDGLLDKGWPRAFVDNVKGLLTGTTANPNAVMLSRSEGREDIDAMEFVKALNAMGGPPPPSGQWAGGREAPRQAPGSDGKTAEQAEREAVANAAKSAIDARYKGTAAAFGAKP